MRGFPLLQVLIVAVIFAAAGLPVWKLTRPAVEVAAAAPSATPATIPLAAEPLEVEASFAPAPADFQVCCQEQTVLEGHGPARQFSTHWKVSLPKDGLDLIVRANWPAETGADSGPAAARLTVRRANGTSVDQSFWTPPGEALAEVVTVPGAGAAAPNP